MNGYFIHRRGGGRKYGDAEVGASVFLDEHSVARDEVTVRDAQVYGSEVLGRARVLGGIIVGSVVGGVTVVAGDVRIVDSLVVCEEVSGRARVEQARLEGQVVVTEEAHVFGVRLGGALRVFGSAVLEGDWELVGRGRIHAGVWRRAPLVAEVGRFSLTECVAGKFHIGCWCRSIAEWRRAGPRLGRMHGWSADDVRLCRAFGDKVEEVQGGALAG